MGSIEDTMAKIELTLAAFPDIKGAFNNVTTQAIMGILANRNMDMKYAIQLSSLSNYRR